MRVLVLGASGMIGSAMFRVLYGNEEWSVWGSIRRKDSTRFFTEGEGENLLVTGNVEHSDVLVRLFSKVRPEVVINCIGLTKHHKEAEDPLLAVPLNALLPHRLADLCSVVGARLIHVSTDCVFAGTRGNYIESDSPDAVDVYGKSKHLGEVDYPHAITLRTSTIGHELHSAYGLLEWFLAQKDQCQGFGRAIFSGLPNIEFARIVRDVIIPHVELRGLYHVGGEPINKHALLQHIAGVYGKTIRIVRDDNFLIDRSLNSTRFYRATGYRAAPWLKMITDMHATKEGKNHVQQ
jgi:dTDP-4-dehydrorhamnose reductase